MSVVLYEGPSILDGKPIVVVMTKGGASLNEKTGGMAQTYILCSDMPPLEAVKSGEDSSICGGCPHRPSTGGSCYVNVAQGPRAIWDAYKRSRYNQCDPLVAGRGQSIRLGAYGDPAAAPTEMWERLLTNAKGWTGYSHQAKITPELKGLCMASADSEKEAKEFQADGWKTFRVKTPEDSLMDGEILCLNETNGIQCRECGVCDGRKINVAINVHGLQHKINKFKTWSLQIV